MFLHDSLAWQWVIKKQDGNVLLGSGSNLEAKLEEEK